MHARPSLLLPLLCAHLAAIAPVTAQCVWGSFDASRINYSAGTLLGTAHSNLRGILTASGGKLGTATKTLTATYLAGIQVFYTSLLKTGQSLSTAEQRALQNWIKAGGHLVVTGDRISLAVYNQFTALHGVRFTKAANGCNVSVSPSNTTHPITLGVTKYQYCSNGVFAVGTGGIVLGNDGPSGNPFLAVVDSTPSIQGRLVVTGDHNMFTNSFIGKEKNTTLATNIAKWICARCNTQASWGLYGIGLAGKSGVPTLIASANPQHGTSLQLIGSNSSGSATTGLITVGLQQTSVAYLGGTLLTSLDLLAALSVPTAGIALPINVPKFPTACGVSVYFQLLQRDAAAARGVSFTRGVRLTVGK